MVMFAVISVVPLHLIEIGERNILHVEYSILSDTFCSEIC
jgi:hypothetical protein